MQNRSTKERSSMSRRCWFFRIQQERKITDNANLNKKLMWLMLSRYIDLKEIFILKLSEQNPQVHTFELHSIVCYNGNHYVTVVRGQNEGTWIEINDSNIESHKVRYIYYPMILTCSIVHVYKRQLFFEAFVFPIPSVL